MTLKVTVSIPEDAGPYEAAMSEAGGPTVVLVPGDSFSRYIHSGNRLVISEVPAGTQASEHVGLELEPSFGQKAVGLAFNPSGLDGVTTCKREFAAIIDRMNFLRLNSPDPEVKRMASVAITEAQTAQMWAVKALTWK